jgi:hypothetical protein
MDTAATLPGQDDGQEKVNAPLLVPAAQKLGRQRRLLFQSEKIWRMRFANFAMTAPGVTPLILAEIMFSM